MTPTPSQDPPIPQGGGGLMGYDHDHGRGGGGGTRNLEHIYWLVVSTHLKNMLIKLDHFPKVSGEH